MKESLILLVLFVPFAVLPGLYGKSTGDEILGLLEAHLKVQDKRQFYARKNLFFGMNLIYAERWEQIIIAGV